jgi:hypothetical protein
VGVSALYALSRDTVTWFPRNLVVDSDKFEKVVDDKASEKPFRIRCSGWNALGHSSQVAFSGIGPAEMITNALVQAGLALDGTDPVRETQAVPDKIAVMVHCVRRQSSREGSS